MKWVFINAVSVICTVVAAILAFHQKDGWGWFLFIAVVTCVYPKNPGK
jgi:hypothetical protein